jgi:hypothetical protein
MEPEPEAFAGVPSLFSSWPYHLSRHFEQHWGLVVKLLDSAVAKGHNNGLCTARLQSPDKRLMTPLLATPGKST